MPLTTRELFARLIKCEAEGEGINGMRGVASVVMNRVHVPYGEYQRVNQGDLRNVIFQTNQFTCTKETVYGEYNPQNIYNMRPDEIHYEIADWALAGNTLGAVVNSLWYYNPYRVVCANTFPPSGTGNFLTQIVQHCYYVPNQAYAET